jgi:hypothetical protein
MDSLCQDIASLYCTSLVQSHFTFITCDNNLQYQLTIQLSLTAAWSQLSSAAVRLRLWSSVFGFRFSGERWALLPRGLSTRLEVTSCQGTISRVRRSVDPETLVTDSGNVFHLFRCHSTAVRCYRFVTVAVAQRWPWDSTLQYFHKISLKHYCFYCYYYYYYY